MVASPWGCAKEDDWVMKPQGFCSANVSNPFLAAEIHLGRCLADGGLACLLCTFSCKLWIVMHIICTYGEQKCPVMGSASTENQVQMISTDSGFLLQHLFNLPVYHCILLLWPSDIFCSITDFTGVSAVFPSFHTQISTFNFYSFTWQQITPLISYPTAIVT